jgi:hypothetical protein
MNYETVDHVLKFDAQVTNNNFFALLVLFLFGAFVFCAIIIDNQEVVQVEVDFGSGLTVAWFFVLSLIGALLAANMSYKPFIIETYTNKQSHIVFYAIILYVLTQTFWALSLFYSRVNRGLPTLMGIFYIAAAVWLTWVCYQFDNYNIYIGILIIIWTLFLETYTLSVASHPWTPVTPLPNQIF